MNSKLFLTILFSFVGLMIASSSDNSDADSVVSDESTSSTGIAPCLECPSIAKVKKNCKRGKRRIVTDRTCYTCPTSKCVKKKYVEGDRAKFCLKHLPSCSDKCDSDESCLVTVQTRYACSKAKCVKKYLNFNRLEDYVL